ncbi:MULTISPECIES: carboxypeptidase-like regulatory domain-containing protein [unclassified Coleofasciculus]|uniref:carboxypeptidase-like regulatory domain-containing protein n=1 Tax=unclassified Coleofasciculus TaxID=2692782 RepID=UPI00187DEF62|nr:MULTISPECIES: carboxypeptidase-like regulatory domain-containing protein [unclassified Coleofasciculus]MBE9126498.1 hypothetical protein [Coleofasciculus sp. LEGE 07081]MBE9149905.1 hypothetical protein [Coleofasciculus sp. LEGE 07092]
MKTYWRNIVFCAGLVLAITTPVPGETSNQTTTPLPPTSSDEAIAESVKPKDYQSAYQNGRREAEANIANGKPSIYTVGLREPGGTAVDQETGLPVVAIAGCIVDDSILGRRDGYNDRIREWVATQPPVDSSEQEDNSRSQESELSTGVEGRSISTTMPGAIPVGVEWVTPIVHPSRVTISVFDETGRKVSSIQPDTEGNFRITLKPGTYTLQPDFPKSRRGEFSLSGHEEQIVTVEAEGFTSVEFNYTTLAP